MTLCILTVKGGPPPKHIFSFYDGRRTRPKHFVEKIKSAREKCCVYSDNKFK